MRSSTCLSSGVNASPKSSASNTWRISISDSPVGNGLGQRLTHSIASSFDFTCHIQNPAMSSFVSGKGPSITVPFAPLNLTRAPFEPAGGPSPASMTPAFDSSSLNLVISASSFSSGITPASDSFVALTMIMNLIVVPFRGLSRESSPYVRYSLSLTKLARRTHFDASHPGRGYLRGELDSLVEVPGVDQVKPGELLLGFRKGPVGYRHLAASDAHGRRRTDGLQGLGSDRVAAALERLAAGHTLAVLNLIEFFLVEIDQA